MRPPRGGERGRPTTRLLWDHMDHTGTVARDAGSSAICVSAQGKDVLIQADSALAVTAQQVTEQSRVTGCHFPHDLPLPRATGPSSNPGESQGP